MFFYVTEFRNRNIDHEQTAPMMRVCTRSDEISDNVTKEIKQLALDMQKSRSFGKREKVHRTFMKTSNQNYNSNL